MKEEKFSNIFIREQPDEVKKLSSAIDDFMYDAYNNESSYHPVVGDIVIRGFHPSQLYKSYHCARKLVFEYTDAECKKGSRSFSAQEHRIFMNGNYVHKRLEEILADLSKNPLYNIKLVGSWVCKVCKKFYSGPMNCPIICDGEVHTDKGENIQCVECGGGTKSCGSSFFRYKEVAVGRKELRITGHADGIIDWDGERYLLEIKSMNPFLFQKLMEVPKDYLPQANIYMYISDIKQMIFLVECKGTQALKEFHINYDPKIANPILKSLRTANKYIDEEKLPPKLSTEEDKKRYCRICEFSSICEKAIKFGYNLKIE